VPYRAIPEVVEEPGYGKVWVVLLQGVDPGAPLQELFKVEKVVEDPVGRGSKGHWQGEESVQDPRLAGGRAVYAGNSEFFTVYKSGTRGRGRRG
jgi:hypothetical protein